MTQVSLTTFWVALGCYLAGMVAYFVYLAVRREAVYRVANTLAWIGLIAQLVSVIARAFAAHRVPWGNMYEYSVMSALIVVGAELIFVEWRAKVKTVGGFALAYAVFTMAIATMFFYRGPEPLQPVLDSVWLKIHVFAMIAGSSMLILGSGVVVPLYLWKRWREGKQAPAVEVSGSGEDAAAPEEGAPADLTSDEVHGGAPRRGILPSSDVLDRVAAQIITIGFFIFTFAVIAGAIWAERAWGRYWNWDPKETWSFVSWVIFASYLHARSTVAWKGKRAAIIALAGFAALMITYYWVNLGSASLHSYAGLPQ